MTSMILFLLMKDKALDALFAKYLAAMKAMPSYEVQVALKSNRGELNADLIIDGRKRLLYDATTTAGDRYTLSISPSGYREVEKFDKTYDEYPYSGQIHLYSSRISQIGDTLPTWLMAGDLHILLPQGAVPTMDGTKTINGQTCDRVKASFEGRMGSGTIEMLVAKSGLLYYYHVVAKTPQGTHDDAWTFSKYTPMSQISETRFANPIPDGYMPHSVSAEVMPVEVDHKADLSGWVDSKTGKAWSPAAGRRVLFVLTTPDSLPSDRVVAALKKWQPALEAKGVQVAIGSDDPTRSGAGGYLFNPSQKSVKALGAPSTPMLFLIDSKGTVRNLWMGFSNESAAKMRQDLLNAVDAAK